MKNVDIDGLINWLVGFLAIVVIAAFFLSSGRVAFGQEVIPPPVKSAPWWVQGSDPVLYTEFDTSTYLDPWYSMFATQLALGVYLAEEKAEEVRKLNEIRAHPEDVWWWYGVALFFSALAGIVFWWDKLWPRIKGFRIWRKT